MWGDKIWRQKKRSQRVKWVKKKLSPNAFRLAEREVPILRAKHFLILFLPPPPSAPLMLKNGAEGWQNAKTSPVSHELLDCKISSWALLLYCDRWNSERSPSILILKSFIVIIPREKQTARLQIFFCSDSPVLLHIRTRQDPINKTWIP